MNPEEIAQIEPATLKIQIPENVGGYEIIQGTFFPTSKKPNWFHRFWCRVFLGWKWFDTSN